jgi:hypothetical protein
MAGTDIEARLGVEKRVAVSKAPGEMGRDGRGISQSQTAD